jgi:hypothetical protein
MDGNAALWLKAYRLRHEIATWPALMSAVEEKFGMDDYRKFLKQMMALKQRGMVEEYQLQFQELSYQLAIQNPNYDEQFYVSHFIRGLKKEIRAMVESQVPETLERAIVLALVQQEVLDDTKPWGQCQALAPRVDPSGQRQDAVRPALKLGGGKLWKDRNCEITEKLMGYVLNVEKSLIPRINVHASSQQSYMLSILKRHLSNYWRKCSICSSSRIWLKHNNLVFRSMLLPA